MLVISSKALLLLSPAFAAASVVYLAAMSLVSRARSSRSSTDKKPSISSDETDIAFFGAAFSGKKHTLIETIHGYDGPSIICFRAFRLLAVLTLLALQVFDTVTNDNIIVDFLLVLFYVRQTLEISC